MIGISKELRNCSPEFIQIDLVPSYPEYKLHISMSLDLVEVRGNGVLDACGLVSKAENVVLEFRTKVQERIEWHISKAKYYAKYKTRLIADVASMVKRGETVPTSFRQNIDAADKLEHEYSSSAFNLGMALVCDEKYLNMLVNGEVF